MDTDYFIKVAKEYVVHYTNGKMTDAIPKNKITTKDVYVVWLNITLQNNKALLSTTVKNGMYYEFTHNGDKDEFYFDAYKHENNYRIKHLVIYECFFCTKNFAFSCLQALKNN